MLHITAVCVCVWSHCIVKEIKKNQTKQLHWLLPVNGSYKKLLCVGNK